MHKSWGNAIEFDEAAERMGVDVMRWMYARQRPEDNILFGYDAANEARRELLVLWNVVAFLVTYARPGRLDARSVVGAVGGQPRLLAPGATPLDRWIVSRAAALAAECRVSMADFDVRARHAVGDRLHRRPVAVVPAPLAAAAVAQRRRADRDAAFAALHLALVSLVRVLRADPAVPGRGAVPGAGRRAAAAGGSVDGPDSPTRST